MSSPMSGFPVPGALLLLALALAGPAAAAAPELRLSNVRPSGHVCVDVLDAGTAVRRHCQPARRTQIPLRLGLESLPPGRYAVVVTQEGDAAGVLGRAPASWGRARRGEATVAIDAGTPPPVEIYLRSGR